MRLVALVAAIAACAAPRRSPETRPAAEAAAAERPGDYAAQVEASRQYFLAADASLFLALVANGGGDIAEILDAENRLTTAQRSVLRGYAEEGVRYAEAALRLRKDDVAAHFYLGLNLTLLAVAKGVAVSLLEGLGTRIRGAYEEAIRLDPWFRGGGPLALKGRFLTNAPWPVRDWEEADRALKAACDRTPNALHLLFLGDLRWRQGKHEEARALWRRAADAPADLEAAPNEAEIRALARLRTSS